MNSLRKSEEYAAAIRCLCAERNGERLSDEHFFPTLNALSVSWARAYDEEKKREEEWQLHLTSAWLSAFKEEDENAK